VVINVRGNSYRLKGRGAGMVNEVQQLSERGSNLTTENGSILNDR
jgi:hypothetical protein